MSLRITSFLAPQCLHKPTIDQDIPLYIKSQACGPFQEDNVFIDLDPLYNRLPHEIKILEQSIEDHWRALQIQSPNVFNGTKFRLHDWQINSSVSSSTLHLQCGLTDYKSYIGTCCSPSIEEWKRSKCNESTKHLSRKLGVSAIVETTDQKIPLLKRSRQVGVYQELYDVPGGHPEPQHIGISESSMKNCNEELRKLCVHELFQSILNEIEEELNLPLVELVSPQLLGIALQSEAYTPSMIFYIKTKLTSRDIAALYDKGPVDLFESDHLLFIDANTSDYLSKQLTPAALGCLTLFKDYQCILNR